MNCFLIIPQCAEQADRIRQTLEALRRAHERIVETLRQLEDQTCPETIDALRRMESSLADMRAETLWLYRTLRAVSARYEETETAVRAAVLALPVGEVPPRTAGRTAAPQIAAAQQQQYTHIKRVSMEDWIRQYPCTSSFRLPGNERADDWLIEQLLRAFADADTDTATDRRQEKQ